MTCSFAYAGVYTAAMDALAGVLTGPRARGAFLLRAVMSPPWSVRVRDEAPLSLVAMVREQAWLVPDDADPVPVRPGDVAILRGPAPYTFADDPTTAPQVVIHPGGRCRTPDGRDVAQEMDLGVRTWGNDPNGPVVMLIGTYQLHGEVSRRLLDVLPGHLVLSGEDAPDRLRALVTLLGDEVVTDEPGQEVVLDRLLDLLLVAVLRTWFAHSGRARRGTGRTAIRSSGRPCGCCTTIRLARGRWPPWLPRSACRARAWRAGSPSCWESRR